MYSPVSHKQFWSFKEFASGRFPYQRSADTVPILHTTMSDRSRVSHVRNKTLDGPFVPVFPLALYQLVDRIKVNWRFKNGTIFLAPHSRHLRKSDIHGRGRETGKG